MKAAQDDLAKAKNTLLIQQIDTTIASAANEKVLTEKLNTLMMEKAEKEKELVKAAKEKENAEKVVDATADVLIMEKLLAEKASYDPAKLQKILKDLGAQKTMLEAVNKLLKDAEVKDTGDKGVKTLLDARKDTEEKVVAVDKVLNEEKAKDKGAKGVLEIVEARKKALKENDDLLATLAAAFKELVDGNIVPADPEPRKKIVAAASLARRKAESPLAIPLTQLGTALGNIATDAGKVVEKSFDLTALLAEREFYRGREKFIETPQKKMDTYIALLQDRTYKDAEKLTAINREAEWVLMPESKSDRESQGKARYVQGLALRNQEKFAEARAAFADSLKIIAPVAKAGPLSASVKQSNLELTDANVYYVPPRAVLQSKGDYQAALAEATLALKAIPTDRRLYALRGLIRYEQIHGKGAKAADELKAIRADADAAGMDATLAGESAYLVGLVEEEVGNLAAAEKKYREAIEIHTNVLKGDADGAGKYRVSLGRTLLKDRSEVAAPPAEEKKKDDEKKKEAAGATIHLHPWSVLVASVVVGQPIEPVTDRDEQLDARLKDAIAEADKLIDSKDVVLQGKGHLLRGRARSKLDDKDRNEGLKEYAKGLGMLAKTKLSEDDIAALIELINDHPAFQPLTIANTPNPVLAERHFGEGIHLYWDKKYPEAEAQFRQAIKYFDRDARYQYFLGLAQFNQNTTKKRGEASYTWQVGARLEAKSATNPFTVRDINVSLERVQGQQRPRLDRYRYRAIEEAESK